jgi:hypothetical protein
MVSSLAMPGLRSVKATSPVALTVNSLEVGLSEILGRTAWPPGSKVGAAWLR